MFESSASMRLKILYQFPPARCHFFRVRIEHGNGPLQQFLLVRQVRQPIAREFDGVYAIEQTQL